MTFKEREQRAREQMAEELETTWTTGAEAQRNGFPLEACPHEGGPLARFWRRGWERAELARKLEAAEAAPHRAALLGLKLARDCEPLVTPAGRDHLRQVIEELQSQTARARAE